MAARLIGVTRACCLVLRVILMAALVTWAAAAPLVWILRDGLGPGMVESAGVRAAWKFLVGWGAPALALVVPLAGLRLLDRWLAKRAGPDPCRVAEAWDD